MNSDGERRVRLSTSSLKQLGCTVRVNPTYTNPKRFSNNGLNQIVIFHASVNPALDRPRDRLLMRRVTKQRDSSKMRLTASRPTSSLSLHRQKAIRLQPIRIFSPAR